MQQSAAIRKIYRLDYIQSSISVFRREAHSPSNVSHHNNKLRQAAPLYFPPLSRLCHFQIYTNILPVTSHQVTNVAHHPFNFPPLRLKSPSQPRCKPYYLFWRHDQAFIVWSCLIVFQFYRIAEPNTKGWRQMVKRMDPTGNLDSRTTLKATRRKWRKSTSLA